MKNTKIIKILICVFSLCTVICFCLGCNSMMNKVKLQYQLNDDGASYTVLGVASSRNGMFNVEIPDTYEGLPVTKISSHAFTDSSIKKLKIGNNVEEIGFAAFSSCFWIEKVEIPENVKNIETFAFSNCVRLSDFSVDENNATYKSIDSVLYSKNGDTLIYHATGKMGKTFVVPENVTTIKEWAINNTCNLVEVRINENVLNIEKGAISGPLTIYCESEEKPNGWDEEWKDENVPTVWNCNNNEIADDGVIYLVVDGVRYGIEEDKCYVATNPNGKREVFIKSEIEYNNKVYKVTDIIERAFEGQFHFLEKVEIPDSVERIGELAFSHCHIKNLELKEGLKVIDKEAFAVTELRKISIPNSVIEIGENAFHDCNYLRKIELANGITVLPRGVLSSCEKLREVNIPSSVTKVEDSAFSDTGLKKVKIPDSVQEIGQYAFRNCVKLTEIQLSQSITEIQEGTFSGCKRLKEISIPENVTKIGEGVFYECKSLKSLSLPFVGSSIDEDEGHKKVLGYIFGYEVGDIYDSYKDLTLQYTDDFSETGYYYYIPKKLKTVKINKGKIGENAFNNCSNIQKIELSDGVTSIEKDAFINCNKLEEVIISKNIESIAPAFSMCSRLKKIKYGGTIEEWNQIYAGGKIIIFEKGKRGKTVKVECSNGRTEIEFKIIKRNP